MDDLKEKTADLADHIGDVADTFYKLTAVKLTQKLTTAAANTILVVSILIFGFIILLFSGIALAWWLGDLVQNRAVGFLLGAAFFLIILLVIAAIRKKTIFPYFRNRIIRKVYE